MSVELDQIIPWGRSRHEYELMFGLRPDELSVRILGCGDGPASFNAEMSEAGHSVISVDPIYAYSGPEIATRFEASSETIIQQVRATLDKWNWDYHRDPDGLLANRRTAAAKFLADYEAGRRAGRYQIASLPELPFSGGHFDLALCSHLLFLYSDHLSEEFHAQSVMELCRVAREVRIFPLLALSHQPSPHIAPVRARLEQAGWLSEIVRVNYEFQIGGNEMLRVFRRE
jgi:hypothetical protein